MASPQQHPRRPATAPILGAGNHMPKIVGKFEGEDLLDFADRPPTLAQEQQKAEFDTPPVVDNSLEIIETAWEGREKERLALPPVETFVRTDNIQPLDELEVRCLEPPDIKEVDQFLAKFVHARDKEQYLNRSDVMRLLKGVERNRVAALFTQAMTLYSSMNANIEGLPGCNQKAHELVGLHRRCEVAADLRKSALDLTTKYFAEPADVVAAYVLDVIDWIQPTLRVSENRREEQWIAAFNYARVTFMKGSSGLGEGDISVGKSTGTASIRERMISTGASSGAKTQERLSPEERRARAEQKKAAIRSGKSRASEDAASERTGPPVLEYASLEMDESKGGTIERDDFQLKCVLTERHFPYRSLKREVTVPAAEQEPDKFIRQTLEQRANVTVLALQRWIWNEIDITISQNSVNGKLVPGFALQSSQLALNDESADMRAFHVMSSGGDWAIFDEPRHEELKLLVSCLADHLNADREFLAAFRADFVGAVHRFSPEHAKTLAKPISLAAAKAGREADKALRDGQFKKKETESKGRIWRSP